MIADAVQLATLRCVCIFESVKRHVILPDMQTKPWLAITVSSSFISLVLQNDSKWLNLYDHTKYCAHTIRQQIRVVLTNIYPGQHNSWWDRKIDQSNNKTTVLYAEKHHTHTGLARLTLNIYDSRCIGTSWKRMMLITQAQSPAAAEDFCRTNSGLNSGSLRCSSLTHLTVASGMCSLSKFTRACRKSSTWKWNRVFF